MTTQTEMPDPIPMLLHCPECKTRHVDVGEFATKIHRDHTCQSCGFTWRPAKVPTVGVQFLPGYKNDTEIIDDDAPHLVFAPHRHDKTHVDERGGHPSHEGPCCLDVLTAVLSLPDAVTWMLAWHVDARGYGGWDPPDPCEPWLVSLAAERLAKMIDEDGYRQRKREQKELEDSVPGPRQIGGPDEASGLPSYYRLDRWVINSERVQWYPRAVDPLDHETMGFCPQRLDVAVGECKRHMEAVTKPARVEAARAERQRIADKVRIMHGKYETCAVSSEERRAGILEGIEITQWYLKTDDEQPK